MNWSVKLVYLSRHIGAQSLRTLRRVLCTGNEGYDTMTGEVWKRVQMTGKSRTKMIWKAREAGHSF